MTLRLGLFTAVAALVAATGGARADNHLPPAHAGVVHLLGQIRELDLRTHVEILSGVRDAPLRAGMRRIASRSVFHDDIQAAVDYIAETLEGFGLAVVRTPFDFPMQTRFALVNLEASLPGTDAPSEIYVLGAHLDSTASREASWDPTKDPAPGADDNATGTAVVLEAARALSQVPMRATVRFVFFSAEEIGLTGSKAYAEAAKSRGDDIRLMVSMDPVGNTGPLSGNIFFTYDAASSAEAGLMRDVGDRYPISFPVEIVPGDNPNTLDDRSDHYHFWTQGFKALHGGSLPGDNYHTSGDVSSAVDYAFVTAATRTVVARLVEAAGKPDQIELPTGEPGCSCSAGSSTSPSLVAWFALAAMLVWADRRRRQRARKMAKELV